MGSDDRHGIQGVFDLLAGSGIGPLWGMASSDLNATLLAWPPGHEVVEYVNAELDVLLVVLDGHGTVTIDGQQHALAATGVIVIERGRRRRIQAGSAGLRYLSVHRRRGPLQIEGFHATTSRGRSVACVSKDETDP